VGGMLTWSAAIVCQLLNIASSGDDLTRTSTWDIFPMTLFCASRTGNEDMPSLFIISSAVARGLSPLLSH
jgi:hypothetical protein